MAARRRITIPVTLAAVFVLTVCSQDASSPVAPPGDDGLALAKGSARLVGTVIIRTVTTGTGLDPDGYLVEVDSTAAKSGPQVVGTNSSLKFPNVYAGTRTVTLSGVASNCAALATSQTFDLAAGATVTITFDVSCTTSESTGGLTLALSTSGSDIDPDGYTATVDGIASHPIGANGSVTFGDLAAGSHIIELSGVADNCSTADSPQTVDITAGATTSATMSVTCDATVTNGDLLVTVTTSGADLDADGYLAVVDDVISEPVATNGTVRFAGLAQGPHTLALAASSVAANCSVTSANPQAVTVTAGTTTEVALTVSCSAPPTVSYTFVGGGDIASCSYDEDEATARLLDAVVAADPGATVFTLGDNAYENGSAAEYANCYHPTWGRHRARTYAALGNHDYQSVKAIGDATPSWDYFGDRAGPRGLGYYSFDLGDWHIIVLNDNSYYGGPGDWSGSAQDRWLQADLAASTKRCTIAIWHQPYVASGLLDTSRKWFWDRLYAAGVEIVLSGHKHRYERLAPLTPDLVRDDQRGLRAFIVGNAGGVTAMPPTLSPHTEAVSAASGVLKLTLATDSYAWEFLPIAGQSYQDTGTGTCH